MSIVSVQFLIFLAIVLLVYYLLAKKLQWVVLLAASYCFYCFAGSGAVIFVAATTLVVYASGIWMDRVSSRYDRKKNAKAARKKILIGTVIVVFGVLFLLKYYDFFAANLGTPAIDILLPMGISFYMFQAIGYCIDIYRGKINAEHSLLRFALFISFFPLAVQGPISRFDNLGEQLRQEHRFSYEGFTFGAQLILWGFIKRLVIADRIAIPVNSVFDSYQDYDGTQIFIAVVLYAVQIYADFSGGIDIVRGAAGCMGIDLIENFKRPYFGNTVAEYWRRWHIALTSWMRDYVFYPLALSKMSSKIGKWGRKHIKTGTIGKQLPSYLPTFITFFLIGIWHGSGWGFIVFGLYNATIIVLSMVLTDVFDRINRALHINTESNIWRVWQIVRTFAIMVIGKCITRAESVGAGIAMLKSCLGMFDFHNLLERVYSMGMDLDNWFVIAVFLMVFFAVSFMQECGINVREKIAAFPLPLRWAIYMAGILAVLILGVYGKGYDAASFIYRGF